MDYSKETPALSQNLLRRINKVCTAWGKVKSSNTPPTRMDVNAHTLAVWPL